MKSDEDCELVHIRDSPNRVSQAITIVGSPRVVALAKVVLSRVSGTDVDVDTIKTIIMFCAVGLTVSLMCASYGLDLSAGFF